MNMKIFVSFCWGLVLKSKRIKFHFKMIFMEIILILVLFLEIFMLNIKYSMALEEKLSQESRLIFVSDLLSRGTE